MHNISISEFDYSLPDEKIAKYPLESRDESKLLVFQKNKISTDKFLNIDKYLPENSLLIFNDTKVIHARLVFQKPTGADIEIFCIEPLVPPEYSLTFQQKGNCSWKCIVGNLKKWKDGKINIEFTKNDRRLKLEAVKIESDGELQNIAFNWEPSEFSFEDILELFGKTPIPPYLHRQSEEIDRTRYQTIYSAQKGSVAAPTAGLHFTPSVFEKLDNKKIIYNGITLHVGAGTFKPVIENNATLHKMHNEHFYFNKEILIQIHKHDSNITAVGTTSLRALESIYWIGVKMLEKIDNPMKIDQWVAYQLPEKYSVKQAMESLLNYCEKNHIDTFESDTSLMIVPGFKFKSVQRLITNFHQPRSTLLLLVAAFSGKKNWKRIYDYALKKDYRFLSYGDSSLLIP